MYVFDSSPLINLFKHYYPERFPSLWEKFYRLKAEGGIISVREVLNEIQSYGYSDRLVEWTKENTDLFQQPDYEELLLVREIFQIKHFQNMLRKKEKMKGKPVADPFVVAKAKIQNKTVVTLEKFKNNSAQLPNVCRHFEIPCINLEEFMDKEGWTF